METTFTHMVLMSGQKCEILMVKPMHFWAAGFMQQMYNGNKNKDVKQAEDKRGYDIMPFLLMQVVRLDGKVPTMQQLEDMMMDDYIQICEVLTPLMNKLDLK
jgi:hypothetical protein